MELLAVIPGAVAGFVVPMLFGRLAGHGRGRAFVDSLLVLIVAFVLGLMIGFGNSQTDSGNANWDALVFIIAVFTNGFVWLMASVLTTLFVMDPAPTTD